MAKDFMKSKGGSHSEARGSISESEIGSAYRRLANEHVELRSGTTLQAQSALSKSIWEKIEARSGQVAGRNSQNDAPQGSGRLYPLSRPQVSSGSPFPGTLRRGRIWIAAAACAAAAFGGLYLTTSGSPDDSGQLSRISFEVEGTTVGPDQAGQGRLIASENGPVGVRLSDKSQINLQPHTTLRLAALSDGVVITRMAQGTLDAEVVHQAHTNYQFFAGPYQVKVIGTAFRLSYEPEGERLDLKMRSGSVEVVGVDGASQTVRGGESLHLEGAQKFTEDDSAGPRLVDAPDPAHDEIDPSAEAAQDVGSDRPQPGTSGRNTGPADFHDLAKRGKFSEIVRTAEDWGIAGLLTSASANQLQELAQAARYSGRFELSERVWTTMSTRFSSSTSGHNAVFFMGRLDEQRGRASSAFARYESYLRRSPQGVYAQEAWGRKLQLSQKVRSLGEARRIAQQYLERYPSGPFSANAKSVLNAPTPK